MGNLAADGPRGGKVSAADQAAIDEALFADTEGSLLTEGPGASTQELEKDLAMAVATALPADGGGAGGSVVPMKV